MKGEGGGDMGRQSLQQMLEDLASKVRMLEREKREGGARIQSLECEVGELAAVIAQASAKVDETLNEGRTADVQQQEAVNVPATSTAREQLGEFSADPQREPKERSSRASSS
jgi:peptidoglycan hydrolase CwlO-like protein